MYISLLTLIAWLLIFSVVGAVMMIVDKQRAHQGRRRISERKLLTVGALGGAWLMWLTMLIVHHKTHRRKFMLGMPAMVVVHLVLFYITWSNSQFFIYVW